MKFSWQRIKKSIVTYILVHLFLSLVSLPILIAWGLPLSLLSPLGNFIFTPFLMLFLLLSSLLFFSELLYIPNEWLAYLLNHLTQLWLWVLNFSSQHFLISFIKPTTFFLFLIPILSLIILLIRSLTLLHRTVLLSLLLIGNYIVLSCTTHNHRVYRIECNNKPVTVIHSKGKICVVDPGAIGRRSSAGSWAQYTLLPEISKQTGKNRIDYFIATKPSVFLFEALTQLCEQQAVQTIYLPHWKGMISLSAWKKYKQLQRVAKENGIPFERVYKNTTVTLSEKTEIWLKPTGDTIPYHDATYKPIELDGIVDNKPLAFYAAKQEKNKKEP